MGYLELIQKINWKMAIVAGIIFMVIAYIVHTIEAILTMSFYTNPAYFGVWSKLMTPTAGPPPASFMLYSLVFNLITGIIFASLYCWVGGLLPKDFSGRLVVFVEVLFAVTVIPGSLSMILLFNLPLALIVYWAISSLVIYFLATWVFIKLLK